MNGLISQICFLFAVVVVCSAVNAGPYAYPYAFNPYGAVRSYFYNGAAPVAPVAAPVSPLAAPVAPVAAAPVAPAPVAAAVPTALGDYYSYASTAAALGYPFNYPYLGAYTGYPYLKK